LGDEIPEVCKKASFQEAQMTIPDDLVGLNLPDEKHGMWIVDEVTATQVKLISAETQESMFLLRADIVSRWQAVQKTELETET
jgi:hypothetical protein